jgi:hypothetical protein
MAAKNMFILAGITALLLDKIILPWYASLIPL